MYRIGINNAIILAVIYPKKKVKKPYPQIIIKKIPIVKN